MECLLGWCRSSRGKCGKREMAGVEYNNRELRAARRRVNARAKKQAATLRAAACPLCAAL